MSKRVMIVDDSMMVRRQLTRTISDAGFVVVEAHDGVDALDKLSKDPGVSLMVLDVNMPNMGGLELLKHLRESQEHAKLPVVMLTTEGQPQLMQQAKALGAKGWIIKPFKPELLVAALHRITQTAQA